MRYLARTTGCRVDTKREWLRSKAPRREPITRRVEAIAQRAVAIDFRVAKGERRVDGIDGRSHPRRVGEYARAHRVDALSRRPFATGLQRDVRLSTTLS